MTCMYICVICVIQQSLIFSQDYISNVRQCPENEAMWNKREILLGCIDGKRYHCLRSSNRSFVEKCTFRLAFDAKKGCPFFQWSNKTFQLQQTESCIEQEYDCSGIADYGVVITDKMYRYPLCILPYLSTTTEDPSSVSTLRNHGRETPSSFETTRYLYTETATIFERRRDVSTTITVQNPSSYTGYLLRATEESFIRTTGSSSKATNYMVVLIGGGTFVAFLFSLCGVLLLVLCKRIKSLKLQSERSKYMSSVPYNPSTSHPYLEDRIYDEIDEPSISTGSVSYVEPNPIESRGQRSSGSDSYLEPIVCASEEVQRKTPSDSSKMSNEAEDLDYTEFIDEVPTKKVGEDTYSHTADDLGDDDEKDVYDTEVCLKVEDTYQKVLEDCTANEADVCRTEEENDEYDDAVGYIDDETSEVCTFPDSDQEDTSQRPTHR